MIRYIALLALVISSLAVPVSAQPPAIITEVRKVIGQNDFAGGEKLIAGYRAQSGITPELLAAMSWMARGSLAAKQFDAAERYANDTYKLATPLLAKRAMDAEAHLPIAIGAAIEVLAQVDGQRGARSEAVTFLRRELAKYKGTSIEMRIQKNVNLLSLEGTVAPALDLSDYIGTKPPALDRLKGKVVLLFFWAHWCADCKAQAPILADLAAKYRDQGFVVVAPTQRYGYVAAGKDAAPDEEKRYIDQVRQASYPALEAHAVPLSEANHLRYGVSTTPTLVLVDRAGIVRLYNPGKMTLAQLDPLIEKTLGSASR
ncbi:MAG TPA: TlpA disulfide reductase family protein [Vicinamibacterales bacterium]|nr:TlpA disulfide reductase family protein [Vicinamibacterales bacterium]